MTQAQQLANLSQAYTAGALGGNRNRLINGDCRIQTRGPINHAASSFLYGAVDRFYVYTAGSTASSAGDWAALPGFEYAAHVTATSAGNTQISFGQRIESTNIYDLAGQPVTLGGWLYTDAAVTPTIAMNTPSIKDNWGTTNWAANPPAGPTLAVGWNLSAVTFTAPASATLGMGIEIGFPNVANGKNIGWTGLQLEPGVIATPFERLNIMQRAIAARRYCQVLYADMVAGNAAAGQSVYEDFAFPVSMFGTPSVTPLGAYSYVNASAYAISASNSTFIRGQVSITAAGYGYGYCPAGLLLVSEL